MLDIRQILNRYATRPPSWMTQGNGLMAPFPEFQAPPQAAGGLMTDFNLLAQQLANNPIRPNFPALPASEIQPNQFQQPLFMAGQPAPRPRVRHGIATSGVRA